MDDCSELLNKTTLTYLLYIKIQNNTLHYRVNHFNVICTDKMEAWQSLLFSLAVVCAIIAGSYVAYEQGMLDPIIEKFG